MPKRIIGLLAAILLAVGLAACSSTTTSGKAAHQSSYHKAEENRANFHPYIPKHAVEFSNYNRAQELYDNPSTIIWCTTTWANPSAPIVTVPIAGKLTSSSVSFFPGSIVENPESNNSVTYYPELTSVDGMYHGSPPPYRYGFTPGGQYVEFNSAMPTLCTTALNSFQRQATKVSVSIDKPVLEAQKRAEAALKGGQSVGSNGAVKTSSSAKAEAQALLEQAVSQGG